MYVYIYIYIYTYIYRTIEDKEGFVDNETNTNKHKGPVMALGSGAKLDQVHVNAHVKVQVQVKEKVQLHAQVQVQVHVNEQVHTVREVHEGLRKDPLVIQ